jgi:hypothetical protein
VVPNPSGGWDLRRGGAERATAHFPNKQETIDYGRQVSRNQQTELVIHGRDGRIQRSDSHGHDPCPPKDKR